MPWARPRIYMGMSTRGPLPLLIYSEGVGSQGKYSIWSYTISYGARRPVPCTPWSCGLDHLWWCGSCLVLWISGVISPQPSSSPLHLTTMLAHSHSRAIYSIVVTATKPGPRSYLIVNSYMLISMCKRYSIDTQSDWTLRWTSLHAIRLNTKIIFDRKQLHDISMYK